MTDPAAPTSPLYDPHEPRPSAPPTTEDCSFCRRTIATTETYHRLTVGMNEDGQSSSHHPITVEDVSELVACSTCQPRVSIVVDGFLERLWTMMTERPSEAAAMTSDDLPPSEPTQPVFSLPGVKFPLNLMSRDAQSQVEEILSLARSAFPPSPEGFTLGLAVGRFLSAGLSPSDIHQLVDKALGAVAPRVPESLQS